MIVLNTKFVNTEVPTGLKMYGKYYYCNSTKTYTYLTFLGKKFIKIFGAKLKNGNILRIERTVKRGRVRAGIFWRIPTKINNGMKIRS